MIVVYLTNQFRKMKYLSSNDKSLRFNVRDAQQQAISRLSISSQAATARRDAELLLSFATGLSRTDVLTHPEAVISLPQLEIFYQAIERRAQSEPVQYIIGVQEFYGLELEVSPAVLIPRPETEHLVEAALAIARDLPEQPRILDVGTGSGAIAIALAHHLPGARITVTDISSAALEVALRNAEKHSLNDRITFLQCDLMPSSAGFFNLICSNPPYIANAEVLETQVAAFEPASALYAGPTGLEIYERLIPAAAAVLCATGALLLEIGYGQQDSIEALLLSADLESVRFLPDLQGIPRVAIAIKP